MVVDFGYHNPQGTKKKNLPFQAPQIMEYN